LESVRLYFNQAIPSESKNKEHHLTASIALLALFFVCMIYDLRDQKVPMPLTVGGLVAAGMCALFHGLWAPVLLTIALILVADFNPRTKRLVLVLTLTGLASIIHPASALICVLILFVWMLWEFGIIGGADAKLLIATMLVFNNPFVLIFISIAGGVQGVIAALQKKKEIPFVVSIFCGTFLFVLYPYLY
jgi:Flp pilus assembly protein protease CpaA